MSSFIIGAIKEMFQLKNIILIAGICTIYYSDTKTGLMLIFVAIVTGIFTLEKRLIFIQRLIASIHNVHIDE